MLLARLILQGIVYHRRLHIGLLAGTLVACAALTGSLLVGDSVRGTLYEIAAGRLGNIHHALDWGNRYFDARLAEALSRRHGLVHTSGDAGLLAEANDTDTHAPFASPIAAVLALRGIAEPPPGTSGNAQRVNRARVYGVDEHYWQLASRSGAPKHPGPQEAYVNEAVARRLALEPGEDLILRLAKPSLMPADAPLTTEQDADTAVIRVRVAGILTDTQGGRFSLSTDQAEPFNIFVDRRWLGELAELPDKANLLLSGKEMTGEQLANALGGAWLPEHLGLRIREHPLGVVQLESERLFIEPPVVEVFEKADIGRPVLTYLVNHIGKGSRKTPYSFVTAGVAPEDTPEGAVCINAWLADALEADAGDALTLSWYEPLPSGGYEERFAETTVHRVLPMDAVAIERDLALQFPGLSDVDSCRNWDIGLPLDEEELLDAANEAYWKQYGQTPKLITSFETGRAWWGNHFGSVMAMRFSSDAADTVKVEQVLREFLDPADLGLAFMPVRDAALQAVDQALDFGALFMGLSMFLIAAALVLLALLYAHGLQQRTSETGILLSVGWTPARVRLWLLLESAPALAGGVMLGALGGAVYARFLLYGLSRFWPAAVADTPLRYQASLSVLLQGALISAGCAVAVLLMCLFRAGLRSVRELLHRDFSGMARIVRTRKCSLSTLLLVPLVPAATVSLYVAFRSETPNPAVWFFVSGVVLLLTGFVAYGALLGMLAGGTASSRLSLGRLLLGQLARRRSRSLGVAAITGCGVFMVVSVASMQAVMSYETTERSSGAGGFTVFAETTAPLRGEEEKFLGLPKDTVVPLRVWDGDDAGCLNLNRAQQPRFYGVSLEAMMTRGAFSRPEDAEALWSVLQIPLEPGVIPALVGDTDTALWGLQASTNPDTGTEFAYTTDRGESFRLRTVGRLPMRLSLFQGSLLISEEQFVQAFPHEAGYRAFLIEAEDPGETAARLNQVYGRSGMDAVPSEERLRAFYAVERAYLAMFLVLGGIGMMLGAGGAAVIVVRNLGERRAEFALLGALGYEPRLIRRMALLENGGLAGAGLLIGAGAAAVTILPLLLQGGGSFDAVMVLLVMAAVLTTYLIAVLITTQLVLARIPLSALRTE